MTPETVLYVDLEPGSRVEAMKLAGVRRYAEACGWRVEPLSEAESRPCGLRRTLAKVKPIGCIVECAGGHADLPPRVFGKTPVVYLDGCRSLYRGRAHAVFHDGAATARAAFRELQSNRPEAFALVGWTKRVFWSSIRERAFREAVRETGLPFFWFRSRGETAAERQVRLSDWLSRLPPRCAVFAVNDLMATEAVQAAVCIGLKIPTDFTLLGVDNDEGLCGGGLVELSSMQIDFERAGYCAAEVLNEAIRRNAESFERRMFGPLLAVRRESTRGFGRREPRITAAMDMIRAKSCDGLLASDVVKELGGSRRLSELRFREAIGHSILDEIISVRLDRVIQMLRDRKMPIQLIAERSGFRTGRALRKIFHQRMGMSLSEWRKRNAD